MRVCTYSYLCVCVCRLVPHKEFAGAAGAFLSKHSTPVFLSPSSPLPFPSCINTLFLTDSQSSPYVQTTSFLLASRCCALCGRESDVKSELLLFHWPHSTILFYFLFFFSHCLIFPCLHARASHLSLSPSPPVCLSSISTDLFLKVWSVSHLLLLAFPARYPLPPPAPSTIPLTF